jgi:hypothetical protein
MKLTGILARAILERMCPVIRKREMGRTVMAMCKDGEARLTMDDVWLSSMKHIGTKPNCTVVNVTGFGYRLRMCFPVLLVRAEERYHSML